MTGDQSNSPATENTVDQTDASGEPDIAALEEALTGEALEDAPTGDSVEQGVDETGEVSEEVGAETAEVAVETGPPTAVSLGLIPEVFVSRVSTQLHFYAPCLLYTSPSPRD